MRQFKCDQCQKDFLHQRKDRRFCSQECVSVYRSINGWSKESLMKGKCEGCNKTISITRKRCKECFAIYKEENIGEKDLTSNPVCKCGKTKTPENTYNPKPGIWGKKCRDCRRKINNKSSSRIKQECVDYKGGKCQICGYSKCLAALDFHHINAEEKDFTLARIKSRLINDKIRLELDKCALVCSNCHREEHARLKSGEPSLLTPKLTKDIYVEIC